MLPDLLALGIAEPPGGIILREGHDPRAGDAGVMEFARTPWPHLVEHRPDQDGQGDYDRCLEDLAPAAATTEPCRQARELAWGTCVPAVTSGLVHRVDSGETTHNSRVVAS